MIALPKLVPLWTDIVMWILFAALLATVWRARRNARLRSAWVKVFRDPYAAGAAIVVGAFLLVAMVDSIHFRRALPAGSGSAHVVYDVRTESLLDVPLAPLIAARETTYSLPLAYRGFVKESVMHDGKSVREFPRLAFGGAQLKDPEQEYARDLLWRALAGLAGGALLALLVWLLAARGTADPGEAAASVWRRVVRRDTDLPVRAMAITATVLLLVVGVIAGLATGYHVLGTDRTGNDVLYQALKSVRTAFIIGSLATLATLPLAMVLGIMAGYFKGAVDEAIQYVYTVLSSVPNVLLIAACVLMVQVYIDQHADRFATGAERADLKLFLLCVILGVTGWASLCRLLRGETLKLRELDYVQAATAFGVGPWRIMARHILPNVMHLVLITTVLDFSALILYEAVLSYVGVGVDPSMNSFGGMINLSRSEMARDPTVWWSFAAAFLFMVSLVLAANLFADGVRDAFDPRSRRFAARLPRAATKEAVA
jgi:peptide/nickel transport system permease protein